MDDRWGLRPPSATPPTRPAFWRTRGFWDVVDGVSAIGLPFAAFAVLASPDSRKVLPGLVVLILGSLSATIKVSMKVADIRRKKAEAEQAKRMVLGIVRVFSSRYFQGQKEEHDKHRVTLFVAERCRVGRVTGKRLAIYARAGSCENSRTTWPIDDDELEKCRGLAAHIWFQNKTKFKVASCDWPDSGSETQKAKYATSLGITIAEAEALNVKSRGFAGSPVIVHGERWGVLLIDTKKKEFAEESDERRDLIVVYATIVGAALEGIAR